MSVFDDVRLPEDVEQGAKGGPRFKTTVNVMSSGTEQRNQDWDFPRGYWDIGYGIQTKADFDSVKAFFYARRGRKQPFRFKDWSDFTATDQTLGVGTGLQRHFLLVKNYTDAAGTYSRRITRPVAGTITVKVNGVSSAFFTEGVNGGYVTFDPGHRPTAGQVVTASFEFDVPVRFDTDALDLSLTWENAGTMPSIPVMEVRDEVNAAPSAMVMTPTSASLAENTANPSGLFMCSVDITDDPFGKNNITLTGADAALFELRNVTHDTADVYLKTGVVLDYDGHGPAGLPAGSGSAHSRHVTVTVDDPNVGNTPDATANFTLNVTDVNEPATIALTILRYTFPDAYVRAAPTNVATIVVTDDALGSNVLSLSGADASEFQITGTTLQLKSGANLNAGVKNLYQVNVTVDDAGISGSHPQDTKLYTATVGVFPRTDTFDGGSGDVSGDYVVPEYNFLTVDLWGGGAGASCFDALGTAGNASHIDGLGLSAGPGQPSALDSIFIAWLYNTPGGSGGTASGGTTNDNGNPGGNGVNYYYGPDAVMAALRGLQIVADGLHGLYTWKSGAGGSAPAGGAGGALVTFRGVVSWSGQIGTQSSSTLINSLPPVNVNGVDGAAPGGGGSGSIRFYWIPIFGIMAGTIVARPGGGSGAHVQYIYTRGAPGAPLPESTVHWVAGKKGVGGNATNKAGDGAPGRVQFVVS